jgi:hypothetical protein
MIALYIKKSKTNDFKYYQANEKENGKKEIYKI